MPRFPSGELKLEGKGRTIISLTGFTVMVVAVGGMRVEWKVIGGLHGSRREHRDGERPTP